MGRISAGSVTIGVIFLALLSTIPAQGQIPFRVSTGFYDDLPSDYYEIDQNFIGLNGDIDEFFTLDGNLAALVDSSWIFMYTEHWESVYRVKSESVICGDPPFLIKNNREVVRSIPPSHRRYPSTDTSLWETLYHAPEDVRIYTATSFRSPESWNYIRQLREGRLSTTGFPRDHIIGGERIINDSTSVGLLLLRTALSGQWDEISLAESGSVNNLNSTRSGFIFTQGSSIHELEVEPYRAKVIYEQTIDPENITCLDYHEYDFSLAGTEGGHLLLSTGINDWRRLDYDFKKPITKIRGSYIITSDSLGADLWRFRWIDSYEREIDRYDRRAYNYDRQINRYDWRSNRYDYQVDSYGHQTSSYDYQVDSYNRQINNYNRQVSYYNSQISRYNRQVDSYNRMGIREYAIDYIQLPSGFTPLSLEVSGYNVLCGGENGLVIQLKYHPYREELLSYYYLPLVITQSVRSTRTVGTVQPTPEEPDSVEFISATVIPENIPVQIDNVGSEGKPDPHPYPDPIEFPEDRRKKPDPDPIDFPGNNRKPDPRPDPIPLPETRPVRNPDPEPVRVSQPKPRPVPKPVPVPEPERKPTPKPDPKPDPRPDPKPDPEPDPKPDPKPKPKPKPRQ